MSNGWEVQWFLIKTHNLLDIHLKYVQICNFLKVWGLKVFMLQLDFKLEPKLDLKLELKMELKLEFKVEFKLKFKLKF